jgi:hypothetical protein
VLDKTGAVLPTEIKWAKFTSGWAGSATKAVFSLSRKKAQRSNQRVINQTVYFRQNRRAAERRRSGLCNACAQSWGMAQDHSRAASTDIMAGTGRNMS